MHEYLSQGLDPNVCTDDDDDDADGEGSLSLLCWAAAHGTVNIVIVLCNAGLR